MIWWSLQNIFESTDYKTTRCNLPQLHIFYGVKFLKNITPAVLLIIVRMNQSQFRRITGSSYDSNSKKKLTENTHIPSISLSQIIHFNTVCQRQNSVTSCLTSAHETQLSIYVVHSQTRSHLLVYKFHDLGLSLSYEQYQFYQRNLGTVHIRSLNLMV